jgi:type I restriction enzyme M protein
MPKKTKAPIAPVAIETNKPKSTFLKCPIRGQLNVAVLAKDDLTISEEARRIDFLHFLRKRKYPPDNIAVETVVLKHLGESGRNKLRCDVIVYDKPRHLLDAQPLDERLAHAIVVAEIKRDSAKKKSGVTCQLEPAMRQLPGMRVMGAYWDNIERLLYIKKLVKKAGSEFVEVVEDSLENLPCYGVQYASKPITLDQLSPPNVVAWVVKTTDYVFLDGGASGPRHPS